jgi:hypothetical protein
MKYFGIFGSICSVLGFILALYQIMDNPSIVQWSVLGLVTLTIAFWIYFYKKPANPLAMEITSKMDMSGKYRDSNNRIQDIVQGRVYLDYGVASVGFPPFEAPPEITLIGSQGSMPEIRVVTKDSFQMYSGSSSAQGEWKWSARGKLMEKVK